jgi:hypothetical protein
LRKWTLESGRRLHCSIRFFGEGLLWAVRGSYHWQYEPCRAMLFLQIEHFQPGSFSGLSSENLTSEFIYFSLITLTSLGYGDILPSLALTKVLAGFEVASGTLYIAIFIGRVVGKFS